MARSGCTYYFRRAFTPCRFFLRFAFLRGRTTTELISETFGIVFRYNVSGLQIEPGMEFDFGAVGPRDAHIRSVSCCPLRKRLLVGSVDSEM